MKTYGRDLAGKAKISSEEKPKVQPEVQPFEHYVQPYEHHFQPYFHPHYPETACPDYCGAAPGDWPYQPAECGMPSYTAYPHMPFYHHGGWGSWGDPFFYTSYMPHHPMGMYGMHGSGYPMTMGTAVEPTSQCYAPKFMEHLKTHLGKKVTIKTLTDRLEGTLEGVHDDHLILKTDKRYTRILCPNIVYVE